MVKKILCQGYLWLLLLLLYAPIFIIMIYSFTEAKVLGNWTGFSTTSGSGLPSSNPGRCPPGWYRPDTTAF